MDLFFPFMTPFPSVLHFPLVVVVKYLFSCFCNLGHSPLILFLPKFFKICNQVLSSSIYPGFNPDQLASGIVPLPNPAIINLAFCCQMNLQIPFPSCHCFQEFAIISC